MWLRASWFAFLALMFSPVTWERQSLSYKCLGRFDEIICAKKKKSPMNTPGGHKFLRTQVSGWLSWSCQWRLLPLVYLVPGAFLSCGFRTSEVWILMMSSRCLFFLKGKAFEGNTKEDMGQRLHGFKSRLYCISRWKCNRCSSGNTCEG